MFGKSNKCRVDLNDKTDLYSISCHKTCNDGCDTALKTKVDSVNAEVKAAQAVKKTETDVSNAKYKAARSAAVAKVTTTEITECNNKCKGKDSNQICTTVGNAKTCCTDGVCATENITTPADTTTTDTTTPGCIETVESSGAITEKCCVGTVCTSKIIAKDSDTCDCDEKYKYAINDAISRGVPNAELAALRARQADCYRKCTPVTVPTPVKKAEETVVTTPVTKINDRRRVVYSSENQ